MVLKAFLFVCSFVIFITTSYSEVITYSLQNGFDNYDGCEDTYLNFCVGANDENFGEDWDIFVDCIHGS